MTLEFNKLVDKNIRLIEDKICECIRENNSCPVHRIGCNGCLGYVANKLYKVNTLLKDE